MTSIDVRHDLGAVVRHLRDVAPSQVRYVAARTLTTLAKSAQADMAEHTRRTFDRPTPWWQNATRTVPATKSNLEASVFLKDESVGKALPLAKTMAHHVIGGARAWKRSEGALLRAGLMAPGEIAVPGAAAQIDAYGNMSRGQVAQILSWFQAFPDVGSTKNSTAATRARRTKGRLGRRYGVRYFFKRDRPGRGIYLATQTGFGSSIKPVLMFVRRGVYAKRFDMDAIARATVARDAQRVFAEVWEEARRTAR